MTFPDNLTPAELRVVKLLTELHEPKRIAQHIGVAVSTIRTQILMAREKASVTTAVGLVVRYLQSGANG